MALFGTQDWLDSFANALNNNESYAEAAKDWEGDFYFLVTPGGNYPDDLTMYLHLERGRCKAAEMVIDPDNRKPAYSVKGTLESWQQIIIGELDPTQAIMTGKLTIKGDMGKLMKNLRAAQELVNSLVLVETQFA
jgi:putative sterol carrier protein